MAPLTVERYQRLCVMNGISAWTGPDWANGEIRESSGGFSLRLELAEAWELDNE